MSENIVFFDDESREVPESIKWQLPTINVGHFVIIIMDDGSRWDGIVSKSNDEHLWLVGGRPLMRVSYAPFRVWIMPWNICAIINLADYVDRIK